MYLPLKKSPYKIVCVHLKKLSIWSSVHRLFRSWELYISQSQSLATERWCDWQVICCRAAVFCCHGNSVTFGIAHTSEFVCFLASFLLKAVKYLCPLPPSRHFYYSVWKTLGVIEEVSVQRGDGNLKVTSWGRGSDGTIKHICRARTACELMRRVLDHHETVFWDVNLRKRSQKNLEGDWTKNACHIEYRPFTSCDV